MQSIISQIHSVCWPVFKQYCLGGKYFTDYQHFQKFWKIRQILEYTRRLPLLFSLWEAVHVLNSVQAWSHRALLFLMKAHAKVFMYLNDPHLMGAGQTMYLVHSPKLRTNFSLKSDWGLELLFSPWIRTSRFKYK